MCRLLPPQVFCNQDLAGGGWTLVGKVAGDDGVESWEFGTSVFADGPAFGDCTDAHSARDCKSAAYAAVPGNQASCP